MRCSARAPSPAPIEPSVIDQLTSPVTGSTPFPSEPAYLGGGAAPVCAAAGVVSAVVESKAQPKAAARKQAWFIPVSPIGRNRSATTVGRESETVRAAGW